MKGDDRKEIKTEMRRVVGGGGDMVVEVSKKRWKIGLTGVW